VLGERQVAAAALLVAVAKPTAAAPPLPAVVGDAMPKPPLATPGDPARGRAIVASRRDGMCLLCHRAPIAEEHAQGDLAPDLAGVGSRLDEGQLRLRLVDPRRLNPESIMPSYQRQDGLARVGAAWKDKPILDAQQIEDVVAWLRTLREARP
jgi:sulfur-oxidizing protein SoxX